MNKIEKALCKAVDIIDGFINSPAGAILLTGLTIWIFWKIIYACLMGV